MRRLVVALVAALLGGSAAAHPLGNFSINRYARLEPGPAGLRVVCVVDWAEVPSLAALREFPSLAGLADAGRLERAPDRLRLERVLADRWESGLHVEVGGRPILLVERSVRLRAVGPSGVLPTLTLRLELESVAPLPEGTEVVYRDDNLPGQLGWRELVLAPERGLGIAATDVGSTELSRELSAYPEAGGAFAQQARGRFRVGPVGQAAPASPPISGAPVLPVSGDTAAFERLLQAGVRGPLSSVGLIAALLGAATLGAAHALSPGHGKTIVGAYLVGNRGAARHALLLGLVVTLTHTVGVFALGLIALFAARWVMPERLFPWLGFASGMLVALIGAMLFHERMEQALGITAPHRHLFWTHSHEPRPGSDGRVRDPLSARSLVALGIGGGLVPCPSAVVVLLAAIAMGRIGLGLLLIVAFSAGLAAVLTAIGLASLHAGRVLASAAAEPPAFRTLSVVSALVVTLIGLAMAAQSLWSAGLLRVS